MGRGKPMMLFFPTVRQDSNASTVPEPQTSWHPGIILLLGPHSEVVSSNCISKRRRCRSRDVKWLAHSHTARWWQRQKSNPGPFPWQEPRIESARALEGVQGYFGHQFMGERFLTTLGLRDSGTLSLAFLFLGRNTFLFRSVGFLSFFPTLSSQIIKREGHGDWKCLLRTAFLLTEEGRWMQFHCKV